MALALKQIIKDSFYELLIVYTILVLLISLALVYRYTLHFEILAVILAVFGISIIYKSEESGLKIKKTFYYSIFAAAIIIIIALRIIPYFDDSIPLGYDTGIYKYGIEHGLQNMDKWIFQGGFEPGFLYLMNPLSLLFSTQFILTYALTFFCVLLGIALYLTTKEFFNKTTALISLLIYSLSIIQFKTFAFMYYKNILGLALMLLSIYFLARHKNTKSSLSLMFFIIFAGILGSVHRPTFYIFGLSYFFYAILSAFYLKEKSLKYNLRVLMINIISGILILVIAGLFYLGKFRQQILIMFEPVLEGFVQTGESPGTFISFLSYQFLTLAYLPFAILGFFYLARKRKFNILFYWLLINFSIVYFQFFFFKRFIIHLDIALIILASLGFSVLIENKKKLGTIVLIAMIFSSGIIAFKESINARPLINEKELSAIKYLNNTEENSFAMATSSVYSPWILGYSGRKTIAPGLFDYNKHNKQEWLDFWKTQDINDVKSFFSEYEKPIYIFIGEKQHDNLEQFPECFETYFEAESNKIYEYVC